VSDQTAPGARTADETDEATAAANVQSLFNTIAPTYDRLNHLLSFGLDRLWWRSAARSFRDVLARPEAKIVDICCGTGDMTAALLRVRHENGCPTSGFSDVGCTESDGLPQPIIGLDFSAEMLSRARVKFPSPQVQWLEGDAMHLPFADASVDLITSAFGFRNLTNYDAGLREIARVLRPGGRVGILDCNQPDGLSGTAYNLYLHHGLPLIGGWLSGEREAYRYLPASIARFPRPPQMLAMMRQAGFTAATWEGYFLHAAGLYTATKP
jgi:demethylmenaquinone methyltransferase/2-methoxy-6-polyprenyl-1,4-benzoquinol methylase